MGGDSDNYAYLITDIAQPQSFQQYGRDNNVILTYNEGNKINKQEINNAIKKKEEERTKQCVQLKNNMKQGQLEAIYENTMT